MNITEQIDRKHEEDLQRLREFRLMDANLLQKGTDFEELPETYVVFITEHDVIGKGRPLYHIDRCILDTKRFLTMDRI